MAYTKLQFDKAAATLLGQQRYDSLVAGGFNRADLCVEMAKAKFLGELSDDSESMTVVQETARNLWITTGSTELVDKVANGGA